MPRVVVRVWFRFPLPLFDKAVRLLTVVAAALALAASVGEAQRPLRITTKKNLTFGVLFPGARLDVPPTDVVRAGVLDVTGPNGNQIEVRFILPTFMSGPAGSTLPLSYTPTSAGFSTGSITTQVRFDPTVPYRPRLSGAGRGTFYLGAVANPGASQRSGSYSSTIIVTVLLTGL